MKTLLKLLEEKSNDYSNIERKFYQLTKTPLVEKKKLKLKYAQQINKVSYSIIIPSYRFTEYLNGLLISLDHQIGAINFEVIIVHNHSKNDGLCNLYVPKNYKIKLIELRTNRGRAFARNVGLIYSKGKIVSFIDSDMLLPSNFVLENVYRVNISAEVVLVNFYKNLRTDQYYYKLKSLIKNNFNFSENYSDDFRYRQEFSKEDVKTGYGLTISEIGKVYTILKETKNFKYFGFHHRYGVWDLPSMLLTIAVTLNRKKALLIGGFNSSFKGWGYEDTHFGAKLIATGAYIVPIYNCIPYRVRHSPREDSLTKKHIQAKRNKARYEELLKKIDFNKLNNSFKKLYLHNNIEHKYIAKIKLIK